MSESVSWSEYSTRRIAEAGLRRSAPRQRVIDLLASRNCAVTALAIDAELEGVGRATVYRAIEQLEELGLIQKWHGKRSIELLGEIGFLGPNVGIPHVFFIGGRNGVPDDGADELALLQDTGTTVIHCPIPAARGPTASGPTRSRSCSASRRPTARSCRATRGRSRGRSSRA